MNHTFNLNGITVTELKRILERWPETNHMGEPTMVFLETGPDVTSALLHSVPLNTRVDSEGKESADLLLAPSCDAWFGPE